MVENLKTTKFNDGTTIPLVLDIATWSNLTSPGYCWYNNNEVIYKTTYGALYNWYSITSGKLCPTGWHVPDETEWNVLIDSLGGSDVAGGLLKETDIAHWNSPNTGATNETGFTANPGGFRISSGTFYDIGYYGYWWTNSGLSNSTAKTIGMSYNDTSVKNIYYFDNTNGLSVRCIKD
jgi:uncharacterized protein (TIGR02145 family)